METTPVRIWTGLYEGLSAYAEAKKMDMSAIASWELMKVLLSEEDLPERAQVAVARTFFEALGETILEKKGELASWVVEFSKSVKPPRSRLGEVYQKGKGQKGTDDVQRRGG